ncbi:transferrin-binding protein-like solute binding protein, partial [Psychrobacter sp. 1U2]|uniref:transferrin-binding protein-like solute binding protein n=1 Tax=Psychrobacter sp. 1U2 TaxID=3453577 RepID=UPI003F47DDC5
IYEGNGAQGTYGAEKNQAPEPEPEPEPEYTSGSATTESGAQSLNIVAGPLGVFNTTTRDFAVTDDSIEARADTASDEVLPAVTVTTSGDNDTDLDNDFKSYTGSAEIPTALGNLPLTYTSVYKDFGEAMRIGHINGAATLGVSQLPVDGVVVTGNATNTLPTDGSVAYNGDATYRELGLNQTIEYGSSAFTADFAAKTVNGNLTFNQAGNIAIAGDITGSQFAGTSGAYSTEGGFYGDDAKYLGGIYSSDTAQGTYGAEKQ